MERFSVIFFNLCCLAILAIGSSTTTETSWNNVHDNTTQVGERAKSPLHLNKDSDASTTSIGNLSSYVEKNTQHLKFNGDREDAHRKEEPSVDLSSHDILLDPTGLIARLSRQAEKGKADYSNPASIENNSNDVESNNYEENRSVVPSKRSPKAISLEGDLDRAEDRYQPPYPYYPYYRRQFPNQMYRANDRREPYRNYWRYPVFPG